MGGAKLVVNENASGIIGDGRAKLSGAQPEQMGDRFVPHFKSLLFVFCYFSNFLLNVIISNNYFQYIFRQLKEDENKKKSRALPTDEGQTLLAPDSEEESNEETKSKVNVSCQKFDGKLDNVLKLKTYEK